MTLVGPSPSAPPLQPPAPPRAIISPHMDPYMIDLNQRLDETEQLFITRNFKQAQERGHDLLRDVLTMYTHAPESTHPLPSLLSTLPSHRYLHPYVHTCVSGCICHATWLLLLQCIYEQQTYHECEELVNQYYGNILLLPYDMFLKWTQFHTSLGHYELVCTHVISYIDHHQHVHGSEHLTHSQYESLIEILLFDGLVPSGNHINAITFIQRNDKIDKKKKQAFIYYLKELERKKYTHELHAQQQQSLSSTSSDIKTTSQTVSPPTTTSTTASLSTPAATPGKRQSQVAHFVPPPPPTLDHTSWSTLFHTLPPYIRHLILTSPYTTPIVRYYRQILVVSSILLSYRLRHVIYRYSGLRWLIHSMKIANVSPQGVGAGQVDDEIQVQPSLLYRIITLFWNLLQEFFHLAFATGYGRMLQ